MHCKMLTIALFSAFTLNSASAHQSGLIHTHPHLAIGNEWLVALLLLASAVLVFAARRIITARQSQKTRKRVGR